MSKFTNKIGELLIGLGKSLCDSKSEKESQSSICADYKKSGVSEMETPDNSSVENDKKYMPKSNESVCNKQEDSNSKKDNGQQRGNKNKRGEKKQYGNPQKGTVELQKEICNLHQQVEKLTHEEESKDKKIESLNKKIDELQSENGKLKESLIKESSSIESDKNEANDVAEKESSTPKSVIKYYFPKEIDETGCFNSISTESQNGAYEAVEIGNKQLTFSIYKLERLRSASTEKAIEIEGVVDKGEARDFEEIEKGIVIEKGSDEDKYWKIEKRVKVRYKK